MAEMIEMTEYNMLSCIIAGWAGKDYVRSVL